MKKTNPRQPAPETLFARKRPDEVRLRAFGFTRRDGGLTYTTDILDGQFRLDVYVDEAGGVRTRLSETASGEEYVLHRVPGAGGAFVSGVRAAYEAVLRAVAGQCFVPDVFRSAGALEVIRYVRETYQTEPEFLWARFSDSAVLRRKDTGKWFGALLVPEKEKLGLGGAGKIEVLDLRIRPEDLAAALDGARFFPGYHMNKKHWYTILLDGDVPPEDLRRRIDASYLLAV